MDNLGSEYLVNNSVFAENNKAEIIGTVVSEPVFSHEVYDETFYNFTLEVPRLSEACDLIQITISEKLMTATPISIGLIAKIKGQFRSYNNFSNIGNKLVLTLFVKDIEIIDETNIESNPNSISLKGYICKPPIYRTTPFGREITDILLAVNRSYNKSDYIPCITWGRNAKYASCLSVGDSVSIKGRIQSRNYQKKISDEQIEEKTAYEISVSKISLNNQTEISNELFAE